MSQQANLSVDVLLLNRAESTQPGRATKEELAGKQRC
jgi:hypothetical protein